MADFPGNAVHQRRRLSRRAQAAGGLWLGACNRRLRPETLQASAKLALGSQSTSHPTVQTSSSSPRDSFSRDWDTVRLDVQEVVGAHAGWSAFIDAVEEEFVGTFLIAPGDAEAFCGRRSRTEASGDNSKEVRARLRAELETGFCHSLAGRRAIKTLH